MIADSVKQRNNTTCEAGRVAGFWMWRGDLELKNEPLLVVAQKSINSSEIKRPFVSAERGHSWTRQAE